MHRTIASSRCFITSVRNSCTLDQWRRAALVFAAPTMTQRRAFGGGEDEGEKHSDTTRSIGQDLESALGLYDFNEDTDRNTEPVKGESGSSPCEPTSVGEESTEATVAEESTEITTTTAKVEKRGRRFFEPPFKRPAPPPDWGDALRFQQEEGQPLSLNDLVFGFPAADNTAILHRDGVDKVEHHMPLYNEDTKKWLFLKTNWLMEVDQYERWPYQSDGTGMGESSTPIASDPDSATLAIPSDTTTTTTTTTTTLSPSTEEKQDVEKVDSATVQATTSTQASIATENTPNPPKDEGIESENCAAPPNPPPTHMDIIGRPKVVRYLLSKYLRQQERWNDALSEVLELATRQVLTVSGCTVTEDIVWPTSRLQKARARSTTFFSVSLLNRLHSILVHLDEERLSEEDPKVLWEGFLLLHALDHPDLPTPNRPPFSFGEVDPTTSETDLEQFRYQTASDDCVDSFLVRPDEMNTSRGRSPTDFTESEWDALNDWHKNNILFNSLSANVASRAVRDNSGIYVVYHIEKEGKEEVESETEMETNKTDEELFLEEKGQMELSKAVRYKVDRFYLGIVEPSLYGFSPGNVIVLPVRWKNAQRLFESEPEPVKEKRRGKRPVKGSLPRHDYYTGGFFHNGFNGELEDAQLNQLWEAFQKADTAVLIDELLHLGPLLDAVKKRTVTEMVNQTAFLLLFFSLSEVRAITSPANTYYRLQALHTRLQSLVYTALCVFGWVERDVQVAERLGQQDYPPFYDLTPSSQVTFACFGSSYIFPRKKKLLGEPNGTEVGAPSPSAEVLYRDWKTAFYNSEEHQDDRFDDLLASQRYAVEFCFPKNEAEEKESRLLELPSDHPERDPPPVVGRVPNLEWRTTTEGRRVGKRKKFFKVKKKLVDTKRLKRLKEEIPITLRVQNKPKRSSKQKTRGGKVTPKKDVTDEEQMINSIVSDILEKRSFKPVKDASVTHAKKMKKSFTGKVKEKERHDTHKNKTTRKPDEKKEKKNILPKKEKKKIQLKKEKKNKKKSPSPPPPPTLPLRTQSVKKKTVTTPKSTAANSVIKKKMIKNNARKNQVMDDDEKDVLNDLGNKELLYAFQEFLKNYKLIKRRSKENAKSTRSKHKRRK